MPTIDAVRKAICCPKGCMRPDDCWAPTMAACRNGAPEAIMSLFAPVKRERVPFQISEDDLR